MLLFQILAAVWDAPGTADDIAQAIAARSEHAIPRSAVEHHVQMLHGCGYLHAAGEPACASYSITPDGSALLARMAQAVDRTERMSA